MRDDIFMQGVELMLFGMSAVILFLTMLVLVTSIMSRLMTRYLPQAAAVPKPVRPRVPAPAPAGPDPEVLAVISAAIHRHRSDQR
ncbi:OadG family protein [Kineobactrum salinum]|uniref:Probable oxaloacetate decarboxylase gamma chain n=1 Tax=Kineobactrum salinum TaxID=2708301 RepID=A0A6C0U1M1_9GAMM|nr:OadG family protein [Kineobactrum salinum]QIB64235.1 OadG family protein [Kineobactrum salinum]